jgi:hypothetical protein
MVTLETDRLTLRILRESDLDAYAKMCADLEVMRYIGYGRPLVRPLAWRNLAMRVGPCSLRRYGLWSAEERSSGVLVGRIGRMPGSSFRPRWCGCNPRNTHQILESKIASFGKDKRGFKVRSPKRGPAYGETAPALLRGPQCSGSACRATNPSSPAFSSRAMLFLSPRRSTAYDARQTARIAFPLVPKLR